MTGIRFILFCSCLLMSACRSPVYKDVAMPVPVPASFSATGEAAVTEKWWESFGDPVLNGLIERALADNLSLRIVWSRLAQAEAVARKAGASRWPSVDGEAGGSWLTSKPNEGTGFSLGVVARYELDLWGRVRSAQAAAALDVRATEQQLRAAAITLSAQVAATWYALVEQRGQLALLKRQLRTNEEVLELVTLRFRRGKVTAADVLRQRQLVEARRGDIAGVEARAGVLSHQLALLLGQAPSTPVAKPVVSFPVLPALPATGLPSELIQARPDIRDAYFQVLAADRRVASAMADRFPRISLMASAETSAEKLRDLLDNWLAVLAANVVAPLFDAGQRSAEVERTRAVLSQRIHEYGQVMLTALGEVEDALAQERKQRELIASLEKQLQLAAQVIERTRDSYTSGTVDYLRVLDALQTHQARQREVLQAKRQLLEFRINLCRSLGRGWEMRKGST